jgi:hypothetical protein
MLLLILPDLVFLGERQEWEVGQVTKSRALDASCREFGLVERRAGPDIRKLSVQAFVFYLA